MLKPQMQFKYQINGRDYLIFCENDSPTPDMKEMACQIIKEMVILEEKAMQKMREDHAEDKPKDEEVQKE